MDCEDRTLCVDGGGKADGQNRALDREQRRSGPVRTVIVR